jgi:hypothetical protein
MTVSVEDFREYVGTKDTSDWVTKALDAGQAEVDHLIGEVTSVPEALVDLAVLAVSAEWYHRRGAPNGITQFASMDGTAYRVARDTKASIYAQLMPFLGPAV